MEGVIAWCKEHKLRTIGGVWVSGIAASMAYNYTKPGLRTSLKVSRRCPRSQPGLPPRIARVRPKR